MRMKKFSYRHAARPICSHAERYARILRVASSFDRIGFLQNVFEGLQSRNVVAFKPALSVVHLGQRNSALRWLKPNAYTLMDQPQHYYNGEV